MKKFAVIQMGPYYDTDKHRAQFDLENMTVYIRTVRNFAEASACVEELATDGVGCMELCGAFGEENARKLIDQTGGNIAIGYCVNLPQQDALFAQFFSGV